MRSIPSLRIRARYAPGWRKSSRGCNAPSCHRGNIIARFHVTHVPSDARTRFRSSWQSAIEAVHQGLRAMRFAVDEGTSFENAFQVKSEGESIVSNFERIDLPHPRDISRIARVASGIIAEEILRDLRRSIFSIRKRSLWIFVISKTTWESLKKRQFMVSILGRISNDIS